MRILLVIPIVFLLLSGKESHRWWAVLVMVIAALTDLFDGILARAFKQETELGKILDPLADKIAVTAVAILLTIQNLIPMWFIIVAVVRDVVILGGGLYVQKKKRLTLQSNTMGKWTVFIVALLIIVSSVNVDALNDVKMFLLIASTIMLFGSSVGYAQRFFRVMGGE